MIEAKRHKKRSGFDWFQLSKPEHTPLPGEINA